MLQGKDELARWMRAQPSTFPLQETAADLTSKSALASWAVGPASRFRHPAVAQFLAGADHRLVAQAIAEGRTVVTHETSEPLSRKRVKIPDACKAVGVSWMTPFAMLRAEGVRLVL